MDVLLWPSTALDFPAVRELTDFCLALVPCVAPITVACALSWALQAVALTSFLTSPLGAALQVQAIMQRKQEEDHQMRHLVQTLQAALEREKLEVHSLREQVCGQRPTHPQRSHVQPLQRSFSVPKTEHRPLDTAVPFRNLMYKCLF